VARSGQVRDVVGLLGDWAVGPGPLLGQLARAVAGAIEGGALAEGRRLPSERALARALFVSRGTTVAAYDRLVADGLVERRPGSGTYVATASALGLPDGRDGSALVHRLVDRSLSATDLVDLSISVLCDADGLPDVTVSTADLRAVTPTTGYSPWGSPALRALIAAHVTDWGLPTTADQVVITTGAQQGISAAAACWLRPGDTVVVEDPCYPGALAAFAQTGARLVGVAVDGDGVRPDELGRALADRPALVYLQPTVQSPTGTVLSESRRRAVADLIRAHRIPLLEDLALADLCWTAAPAPVAARCAEAPVAVVGSLSKVVWGGLRLGFVRAPEPLALRFARVKATGDLGSSAVSQLLAERLLSGPAAVWWRRSDELRRRYQVLADALARRLPAWRFDEPAGGLSLWVGLDGVDAERFAQTALRHGVAVATAAPLSVSDDHGDRIRLSFASPAPVLGEGVERLARAWEALAS
jgi:DNA-binding transcriptional MocR family regulator